MKFASEVGSHPAVCMTSDAAPPNRGGPVLSLGSPDHHLSKIAGVLTHEQSEHTDTTVDLRCSVD